MKEYPMSNYNRYFTGAMQTYEIFKKNPNQIYRTKTISIHYITGMTNHDYFNDFLPFVKNISSEDFAI